MIFIRRKSTSEPDAVVNAAELCRSLPEYLPKDHPLVRRAKPLPNVFKKVMDEEPSDEVLAWVVYNAETWRPRRSPHARCGVPLEEPIIVNGGPYGGLIIVDDGRLFLADRAMFEIMGLADGKRTLNDIVAKLVASMAEVDEELRRILMKDERELSEKEREILMGAYSVFYVAAALLKEKGFLI